MSYLPTNRISETSTMLTDEQKQRMNDNKARAQRIRSMNSYSSSSSSFSFTSQTQRTPQSSPPTPQDQTTHIAAAALQLERQMKLNGPPKSACTSPSASASPSTYEYAYTNDDVMDALPVSLATQLSFGTPPGLHGVPGHSVRQSSSTGSSLVSGSYYLEPSITQTQTQPLPQDPQNPLPTPQDRLPQNPYSHAHAQNPYTQNMYSTPYSQSQTQSPQTSSPTFYLTPTSQTSILNPYQTPYQTPYSHNRQSCQHHHQQAQNQTQALPNMNVFGVRPFEFERNSPSPSLSPSSSQHKLTNPNPLQVVDKAPRGCINMFLQPHYQPNKPTVLIQSPINKPAPKPTKLPEPTHTQHGINSYKMVITKTPKNPYLKKAKAKVRTQSKIGSFFKTNTKASVVGLTSLFGDVNDHDGDGDGDDSVGDDGDDVIGDINIVDGEDYGDGDGECEDVNEADDEFEHHPSSPCYTDLATASPDSMSQSQLEFDFDFDDFKLNVVDVGVNAANAEMHTSTPKRSGFNDDDTDTDTDGYDYDQLQSHLTSSASSTSSSFESLPSKQAQAHTPQLPPPPPPAPPSTPRVEGKRTLSQVYTNSNGDVEIPVSPHTSLRNRYKMAAEADALAAAASVYASTSTAEKQGQGQESPRKECYNRGSSGYGNYGYGNGYECFDGNDNDYADAGEIDYASSEIEDAAGILLFDMNLGGMDMGGVEGDLK